MLRGMMMDRPLLVSSVIDFAAETYPDVEIVSQTVEGGLHRYGYAAARERIGRLANALLGLGIKPGDRVATLAWNGYRHFELYYAIAGIGAVCHTINPRLFPEQITYIANHAEDTALFFDLTFLPLLEKIAPTLNTTRICVLMTDRAHMPAESAMKGLLCYEDLLADYSPELTWPEFDEHAACALCYTSGTTGEPKGVLYSNRSMLLHTFFLIATRPDLFAYNRTILPVVPLFHANAWSLPYVAPLAGCPFILPGAKLDGPTLYELMESEGVEAGWGVPTVWLGLLEEFKKRGRKPRKLSQILSGGSAVPRSCRAISTIRKHPPDRSTRRAGSAPAMSPRLRPTAGWQLSTAPRTSSNPAASGSVPSTSRTPPSPSRASPIAPSSACRIPSGTSGPCWWSSRLLAPT